MSERLLRRVRYTLGWLLVLLALGAVLAGLWMSLSQWRGLDRPIAWSGRLTQVVDLELTLSSADALAELRAVPQRSPGRFPSQAVEAMQSQLDQDRQVMIPAYASALAALSGWLVLAVARGRRRWALALLGLPLVALVVLDGVENQHIADVIAALRHCTLASTDCTLDPALFEALHAASRWKWLALAAWGLALALQCRYLATRQAWRAGRALPWLKTPGCVAAVMGLVIATGLIPGLPRQVTIGTIGVGAALAAAVFVAFAWQYARHTRRTTAFATPATLLRSIS
jgi:hypothetical protein